MKKFLLLAMALPTMHFAQVTTVFSEDFETTTDLTAAGWTMYNDTNTPNGSYAGIFTTAWQIVGWSSEGGNTVASTVSWFNPGATANRWLVSPAIVIPANVQTASLTFKARAHDDVPYADGFSLKISSATTAKADFTTELRNVPSTENTTIATSTPYTVDLSAYKGKTIYLTWVDTFNDGNLLSIDDIAVTTTPLLATDEVNSRSKLAILYPNPAKDEFKINMKDASSSKTVKVTLTDMSGKVIRTYDGIQDSYDISSLEKGAYMVTVSNGKDTETKKLIKK